MDRSAAAAIAWKETPEAARAITAALPFIRRAKKVFLVEVEENGSPAAPASEWGARPPAASQPGGDAAPRASGRPRCGPRAGGRNDAARRHHAGHGRIRAQPGTGDDLRRLHPHRAARSSRAHSDGALTKALTCLRASAARARFTVTI